LTSYAIAGLTSIQVKVLSADQISWIPTSSIIGFKNSYQLTYIMTNQIEGFSADQIIALDSKISNFTTQVFASMTKAQANAITSNGLSALYSLTPRTAYGIVTQIKSSI